MHKNRSFVMDSLKLFGLILGTQLIYYLLRANWQLFFQVMTAEDIYYKTSYLADLRIQLILSYILAIGIKGFQISRTRGLKPLTVIESGISIDDGPNNPLISGVLLLLWFVFIYFQIRARALPVIVLIFIASFLTFLTPTYAFISTSTAFYKNCFSHKNRLYFANDLSDIYEEDHIDSNKTIISFKHNNTVYKMAIPMEHLTQLRDYFKDYLNQSKGLSDTSAQKWENRP